jgi:hypothetical protein
MSDAADGTEGIGTESLDGNRVGETAIVAVGTALVGISVGPMKGTDTTVGRFVESEVDIE